MRADIHDGQERERSTQGPDTEAQDQQSSDRHFWLATHGRSIQMCQIGLRAPQLCAEVSTNAAMSGRTN